jgi:hypothetical protein
MFDAKDMAFRKIQLKPNADAPFVERIAHTRAC